MVSGITPTGVAKTGVPQAMASRHTRGPPSLSEGGNKRAHSSVEIGQFGGTVQPLNEPDAIQDAGAREPTTKRTHPRPLAG